MNIKNISLALINTNLKSDHDNYFIPQNNL